MSIIISKNGQNAKKLERTVVHQEDYLQEYIDRNVDCIPLHDLKENFRLLILAREFATPRGGYIDLLGIDADGEIYIIETKLAKNADRRRILAQALDYGSAIWGNASDLLARVDGDRGVEIQFEPLDKDNPTYSRKLRDLLEGSSFLKSSDPQKYPRISISGLPSRVSEFMQLLQKSLDL